MTSSSLTALLRSLCGSGVIAVATKLSAGFSQELQQKLGPKPNGQRHRCYPDTWSWRGLTATKRNGVHIPAFHPDMSDTFKIVPLSNGRFRAEKLVMHDQTAAYVSAIFRTRREARHSIDRQDRPERMLRIDYVVTPADDGTYRVAIARPDRETPEVLGEFSTEDDANAFVRRMRELDAGQAHGREAQ